MKVLRTPHGTAKGEMHHHDSVNLSWDKPDSPIVIPTAYRVDVAEGTLDTAQLKWKKLEPDTRHSDPTYDHRGWRPKDDAANLPIPGLREERYCDRRIVNHRLEYGRRSDCAGAGAYKPTSTTVSASQIDLVWQKPINDGGTDIAKYCVLATTQPVGTRAARAGPNCTLSENGSTALVSRAISLKLRGWGSFPKGRRRPCSWTRVCWLTPPTGTGSMR